MSIHSPYKVGSPLEEENKQVNIGQNNSSVNLK